MDERSYSTAYNHLLGGLKTVLRCTKDEDSFDIAIVRSMLIHAIHASMDEARLPADAGEREFIARMGL